MQKRALPAELLSMSEELRALGGGDATVAEATVLCRICPPDSDEPSIVWADGDSFVHVRDPRCTDETPAQRAIRRYRVSEGGVLDCCSEKRAHEALFELLGRNALDWTLSGFNAAVVTTGERGSGKTHALFGSGTPSRHPTEQHGLCSKLLSSLFDLSGSYGSSLSVGLSCWEVRHNGVFDLLARGEGGGEEVGTDATDPQAFVTVSAPSLPEAHQILGLARNRSVNWAPAAIGSTNHAALPNRASFFVRLVIHDTVRLHPCPPSHASAQQAHPTAERLVHMIAHPRCPTRGTSPSPAWLRPVGLSFAPLVSLQLIDTHTPMLQMRQSLSSLYLVDLAGSAPLSTGASAALNSERKALNQQLLAFHRVIAELSQVQSEGGAKILSARDSKLTQVLTPLLAGSCKTYLLACVRPEAEHFLDTCNTLRVATRALAIRAPCVRLLGVSTADVPMLRCATPGVERERYVRDGIGFGVLWIVMPMPSSVLPPNEATRAVPLIAAPTRRAIPVDDEPPHETTRAAPLIDAPARRTVTLEDDLPMYMSTGHTASPSAPTRAVASPGRIADADHLKHEVLDMVEQLRSPFWNEQDTQTSVAEWVRQELARRVEEKLKAARGAAEERSSPVCRGYAAQHAAQRRLVPNPAKLLPEPHEEAEARPPTRFPVNSAVAELSPSRHVSPPPEPVSSLSSPPRASACLPEACGTLQTSVDQRSSSLHIGGKAMEAEVRGSSPCAASGSLEAEMGGPLVQFGSSGDLGSSGKSGAPLENYETVLRMLKEVDRARSLESQRAEELEHDIEERDTTHALEAEELKRENLELRKKLRRLQADSLFSEVFELYEGEIASLQSDLAAKRTEALELESACRDTVAQLSASRQTRQVDEAETSESPQEADPYVAARVTRIRNWRRALAASEKENAALRIEIQEMAKRMRMTEVHRRACDEMTRRLQRLAREKEKQAAELTAMQLAHSEVCNQHEQLKEQLSQAEAKEQAAQGEVARLNEALQQLRATNAKLEYERRKDAVVMRMAPRLPATDYLAGKPLHLSARRSRASVPEILHNLESELRAGGARNPKATILLGKAMREVDALEAANQEGAAREEELLQMLVSAIAPEGGRPAEERAAPASGRAAATSGRAVPASVRSMTASGRATST